MPAQDAKPARSDSDGNRKIVIRDWKPHQKNTLQGFFTATLPSGLVLHSLMLHEKGDARWIGFPSREWTDQKGETQYSRFVEFTDNKTANRFRDPVLEALDEYLEMLV